MSYSFAVASAASRNSLSTPRSEPEPVPAMRERQRATRIFHPDVQRRVAALRQAADVRLVDLEMIHHGDHVVAEVLVAVGRRIGRNVGGMIAAERERHAAIAPREVAHLRLPGAPVAGELVHEDERRAGAGFLVMQAHVVAGRGEGHGRFSRAIVRKAYHPLIPAQAGIQFLAWPGSPLSRGRAESQDARAQS